jgi:hypothetical protein
MSLVKVTGTKLIRDTKSMALINTDTNEKNEYYSKLRLIKAQKEEINNVKEEINSVKEDVKEIKSLLLKLLENKGS